MKYIQLLLVCAFLLIVSGCANTSLVTKAQEFPEMYNEKPRSLLIMPPINASTAADAKDYYATTVEMPIAFQGYYTFPYELTTEILKQEGIYDSELVYDMPLTKFKEYFGADAVLFTKIVKWDTSYMVLASNLTVSIPEYIWEHTFWAISIESILFNIGFFSHKTFNLQITLSNETSCDCPLRFMTCIINI